MIHLFFKTQAQMSPGALILTKEQETNLLSLISVLGQDDKTWQTTKMAIVFSRDIQIAGARIFTEDYLLPVQLTDVHFSFPTGMGRNGLLNVFRWKAGRLTKVGLGTSDEHAFTFRHLSAGPLRNAADTLLDGMLLQKPELG
jgi:hypothetical protein